jgi:lipopolysaccharide export LptBFGC system permease protein LptF
MRTLDRYIIRQYLFNIVLLHVVLFTFVIVVDFSLNFDEFVEIAQKTPTPTGQEPSSLRTGLLAAALVLDLWWPRLFLLFNYLLGLMLVGGMGFTCAQMVKQREFVAMLASGQSLTRVARPLIMVAIGLTLFQGVNREIILPRLAELLTRTKDEAGQRSLAAVNRFMTADAKGRIFYARSFDATAGSIDGLWIYEIDGEGLMTGRITAKSARWREGAWVLQDGRMESRIDRGANPETAFRPVASIETDLSPTLLKLRRYKEYRHNLSTQQVTELLAQYRQEPEPPIAMIRDLERNRWGRLATMAANLLSLLICLPFFLQREPTSMIIQSLKCAPIALISQVGGVLGAEANIPGLPPHLSVFLPVMILLPLAIASMTSVKS